MLMDIAILALFAVAIYGFILMTGARTRTLTRKTTRRAEDLYDQYGDSPRKQRRYAREHGGQWKDEEPVRLGTTAPPPRAGSTVPPPRDK
jgi:hypothetical protein